MTSTSVAAGIAESLISSDVSAVASPSGRYLRFGPFHLDAEQQELFKDGARIKVQGKVCEALMVLLRNPGELVTRETLRARLWPSDSQINYDANVNTTVNKLRQALGDTPEKPVFVETIPRKGYSFIAQVEPVEQPAFLKPASAANSEQPSKNYLGASLARFIADTGASVWVTAGAVALLVAGMLFGAAIVLYAHHV
jgi:DNA-binding winged helix-turn-helix (wHTH) protein